MVGVIMERGPRQKHLPGVQTREQALADIYERVVRIESKLSKLLLHQGLDENGFPRREKSPVVQLKELK